MPTGRRLTREDITPEMLEAGVLKLYSYDPDFGNEEDIVAAIFIAMSGLAPSGRRVSPALEAHTDHLG
jgi:hypothetical protein